MLNHDEKDARSPSGFQSGYGRVRLQDIVEQRRPKCGAARSNSVPVQGAEEKSGTALAAGPGFSESSE
jgi:hypothetical protein